MTTSHSGEIAKRAELIYEQQLKADLEKNHLHEFVAIEPDSGEYFLGHTLSEAIAAARRAYPERIPFVTRIGHRAAIHIGMCRA